LLDTEADRKYFAAELAKREVIIDDLAREKHSKIKNIILFFFILK
jgi:hypothetical protein